MESDNAQLPSTHTEKFRFYGSGGEYFGIWFVNILLTLLTLGIYSAWAKVRTMQYFYGNTELAGGRFRFTASPLRILRGRIIAVALLALYVTSDLLSGPDADNPLARIVFFGLIIAYFLFAPVLAIFVMSFRMRYSQWRGVAFQFNRDYVGGYRVYSLPMAFVALLSLSFLIPANSEKIEDFLGLERYQWQQPQEDSGDITTDEDSVVYDENTAEDQTAGDDVWAEEENKLEGQIEYVNPYFFIAPGICLVLFLLLLPYFDFISSRYLVRNVRIGLAPFTFVASAGNYYRMYGKLLLILVVLGVLAGLATAFSIPVAGGLLITVFVLTLYLWAPSYLKSGRYNLLCNNTVIDNRHCLVATTTAWSLFALQLTNGIVVMLSAGFMVPWAKVRTAAYFLERSSLKVQGSLDDFVVARLGERNALAEEVVDVFDLGLI